MLAGTASCRWSRGEVEALSREKRCACAMRKLPRGLVQLRFCVWLASISGVAYFRSMGIRESYRRPSSKIVIKWSWMNDLEN
jgi:hypothetical protein